MLPFREQVVIGCKNLSTCMVFRILNDQIKSAITNVAYIGINIAIGTYTALSYPKEHEGVWVQSLTFYVFAMFPLSS